MKRHPTRFTQLCVLLLCATMVGAQTPPPSQRRITPNFSNVDVLEVAKAVGEALGITFIPAPTVRAQVTLITPPGRSMSPQEFYQAFLAILAVNGLSLQRDGNSNRYKIVPENVAKLMPGNDLPANLNSLGSDETVTTVLEASNINIIQVSQALRQLLGPSGVMQPVPGTNTMVIFDRAGNVARIKRLLAQVDQASNSGYQAIPLRNALASEVARLITTLTTTTPAEAAATPPPKITADERTNQIIVIGEPAQRLRVADLVESLDTEVNDGGGVQVITLKYAVAEDLAATLKGQVTATAATTTGGGAAGAPAAPSVQAAADRSVNILADKVTNKLIITAPPRVMQNLRTIIEALDIAPMQVHIEAIVAEVKNTKAAALGVNWAIFSNEEGTNIPLGGFVSRVAGASVIDLVQGIQNPEQIDSGALEGATFGVGRLRDNGLNLAAVLRALRKDIDSNIISTPNVTAKNNEEAEMKSGSTVPFLTGQFTNTGGGNGGSVNPFNTVQREDVGTTLKVTPQIIPGEDEVILKIELESSALTNQSGDAGSRVTSNNSVRTSVRVRSGTTIVIGGMMKNSSDTTESRVPGLSRIPVIGYLFKDRSRNREESSLMIFIQPRILLDAVQANAETTARANQIRQMQSAQGNPRELLPLLPNDKAPQLPSMVAPEPAVTPTNPGPQTRP